MALEEQLRADQTAAMKARDTRRLSCIRMLRSRIQEATVAARSKRGADATLDDEELRTIVTESVAACGATSAKDMGAVMKLVMPRVQGQADGKRVNQFVREALG